MAGVATVTPWNATRPGPLNVGRLARELRHDDEHIALVAAREGVDRRAVGEGHREVAVHDRRECVPQLDATPVVVEDRCGDVPLGRGVELRVVRVDPDPRRAGRQPGLRPVGPLRRRPGVVASDVTDRGHRALDVLARGNRVTEEVERLDVRR